MFGVWRVEGILALSRAFGDRHLRHLISAEPDIFYRNIQEDDLLLIIATDGLWDVLSPQEAAKFALEHDYQANPQEVAQRLAELALERGSQDNITCLIIDLQAVSKQVYRKPKET
jgi:protein phosphatase 1L